MLAAAAIAALALSACGGGGSAGRSGGGGPINLDPSLTAGGVTASVSRSGGTTSISIEGDGFGEASSVFEYPPVPAGWSQKSYTAGSPTGQIFRAITNIDRDDDADFLVYGYWAGLGSNLRSTPKPFYWGKTAYAGNLGSLTGSATYRGGAAGAYTSTRSDDYQGGQFTANIRVNVDFDEGQVRGTMDNIKLSTATSTVVDSFLSASETIRWRGKISGFRILMTWSAHNGASWGGRFWGPSAGGALPTGVAGYFYKETLRLPNDHKAYLNGSFGATR